MHHATARRSVHRSGRRSRRLPSSLPLLLLLALSVLLLAACTAPPAAPAPTEGIVVTASPKPPPPTPTVEPTPEEPLACMGGGAYPASVGVPAWPPYGGLALTPDAGLQGVLDALVPADGSASVEVIDVSNRRFAAIGAGKVWYPASLYKLPLLVEALWQQEHGMLDPERTLIMGDRYANADLGTLEAVGLSRCAEVTVAQTIRNMTVASDNASAHLVLDLAGGATTDRHLTAMGLTHTQVSEPLSTTAADMARLLEAVSRGYPSIFVGSAAQTTLLDQWVRLRIPSGIDDPAARVGNKTGDWEGAVHDAAIVRNPAGTYVIVILTDGSHPTSFFTGVSRAVYQYLNPGWTSQPQPTPTPSATPLPTQTPTASPQPTQTPPAQAPPAPTQPAQP